RLYKSIAQHVVAGAEGGDGFGAVEPLRRLRANSAIIDKRTIRNGIRSVIDHHRWRHEIAVAVQVTGAEFRDLADAARHRVLVTIRARFVVVYRAKSICGRFLLFELVLADGKSVIAASRKAIASLRTRRDSGWNVGGWTARGRGKSRRSFRRLRGQQCHADDQQRA